MKKNFIILISIIALLAGIVIYLSRPPVGISKEIKWNAAFSKPFAIDMGLDWREAYIAILDDLKPEALRLPIYWQDVEPEPGKYKFDDYDWMVKEAEKRNIKLVLVIGQKLPRWPECHLPNWAVNLDGKNKQDSLLKLITELVGRYKNSSNLWFWQVENEPFLPFGECVNYDGSFLDQEIELVRREDPKHQIIVTDSGELSIWFQAAKRADVFGTTMYRVVYKEPIGYFKYPLPPKFFWFKANLVHLFYPGKLIIVSELQAEPWGPKLIYDISLAEQEKSMNLKQFRDNIEYARAVGFPEVYLWGAEWWYWMRTKHQRPEFWQEAKLLINQR